jgi:hypothetical protein
MKDLKLEIKNLKMAGREDTLRFQLNLYINKKHAAIISSAGTGGSYEWLWLNDEAEKLFNEHLAKLIAAHHFKFDFEQNDELIDEMIEDLEIKQACKKFLCIKIKGEESYRIMSEPDSPEARQWALALFAHKEFEYLNDRYPAPKSKAKTKTTELEKTFSTAASLTQEELLAQLEDYIIAQKLEYNPSIDTIAKLLGFDLLSDEHKALLDKKYPFPEFGLRLWFNLDTQTIIALKHFIKASGSLTLSKEGRLFYDLKELRLMTRALASSPTYDATIRLQLNGLAYTLEQLLNRLGWMDKLTETETKSSEAKAEKTLTQSDLTYQGKLSDSLAKELTRGLSFTKSAGGRRRYLKADIQNAIHNKLCSAFIRKETREKLNETLNWLRD